MDAKSIKDLPRKFDFKSKLNPLGVTYHAKEEAFRYVVTARTGKGRRLRWVYSKELFRKRLLSGEFVPLKKASRRSCV